MKTPLVSPEELAAHPEWRVFDCRHDLARPALGGEQYAQGHVPGALHAHLDHDLSGPRTGRNGRHPLPARADFVQWLGRQGLRGGDQVVAYDGAGTAYAARLWWLLRWVGHEAVAVLDGGIDAWQREGRPLTAERPQPAPTAYDAAEPLEDSVDVDFMLRNLERQEALVVDARGAGRYAGVGETVDPVAGHIPGARNRPYTDNLDAEGRFKPAPLLREELQRLLGATPVRDVVAQCGSGVTACHHLLALRVAGLEGARLYPGSWSEWIADPARPVATGSAP
jgi:thiosulfate/3-mercaptopyruvate sulfurtransferase